MYKRQGEDSRLEGVYTQLHDLGEFTDPKNYKTYDELKAKLMRVLGEEAEAGAPTMTQMNQINDPEPPMSTPMQEPITADKVEDDDTMSYFAKLANED